MAKGNYTASEELIRVFKKSEPHVDKVYVGSTLKKSIATQNNRYIHLLYQDFPSHHLSVEYLLRDNFHEVVLRKIKGEQSIVHHHWLQFDNIYSLKPLLKVFFGLLLFKVLGGTIVWTLHNKLPHNNPYPKTNRWIRRYFAKIATHLHVHCPGVVGEMSSFLKVPQRKFFVVKHPDYPVTIVPQPEAWTEIKQKYDQYLTERAWNSSETIYLMFGQIKPYKGIEEVVDMFLSHSAKSSKKLLVVGRIKDEDYGQRILAKASGAANIILIPEFVPNEDASLFYGISQYVIFNYTDILTSGGAVEAVNYQKNIIVPNKGCLTDLSGENIEHFNTLSELEKIIFP
jgi:glycosyltransferase involved in cell wall biosynthesis